MTNQRTNDVDTITTISSADRILVNTDVVNNVLEQIEKDDFIADIISADANNLIDIGTDNKLFSELPTTVTTQGNTFNGNSQLIQTNSSGQYPALDGSLITGVSATIDKTIMQIATCSTASATAEKDVTLSGFVLATGATIQATFTNANTVAGGYLSVGFDSGNANDDYGMYSVTTIGSPTYTGNKFNSNDNTGLSYNLSSLGATTFCIQGKFTFGSTNTIMNLFYGGVINAYAVYKDASNKLGMALSSDGSTWNLTGDTAGTKSDWANATDYWIRFRFTGTAYLVDWSIDGTNWTNDITFTSSTSLYSATSSVYFGINPAGARPLIGTMDDIKVSIGESTAIDTRLKLNVNGTGAKAIYNESGTAVSGTNPAYFPSGSTVEFTYDGTNWIFKKRVIENYINGTSWYRVYSDGWIEQGGRVGAPGGVSNANVSYLLSFINTNHSVMVACLDTTIGINNGVTTPQVNSRTTTGCVIRNYDGDSSCGYEWIARGY